MQLHSPGRRLRILCPLLLPIAAGACSTPNTSGNTSVECRALAASGAQRPAHWAGTVFTIVMENKSRAEILGNVAAAPFINGLAQQGAVALRYHDAFVHPSEPNYIWMVAGQNFGILSDDDPGPRQTISSTSHLADQIERAGLTWKSYQESMGSPCGLKSRGDYAVKHNPFAYFSDINGWDGTVFQPSARCDEHLVDGSQLDADLAAGTVPDYAFITPNLRNDMHDGSVQQGDAWLAAQVPKLMASDAYQNGGVLFLTWDEGSDQTDDPPFIVVSPNVAAGTTSVTDYDTSSFLMTAQKILGLESLPCAAAPQTVSAMDDLFAVPLD